MLKRGARRTRGSWNLTDTIPSCGGTYALSHMLWHNDQWCMLTTCTTKSERMKDVKHLPPSHHVYACGQHALGARETHSQKSSSCGSFHGGQEQRPARRALHCARGKPSLPCNGQGGFPHGTTFQQPCPAITRTVCSSTLSRGVEDPFFPCLVRLAPPLSVLHTCWRTEWTSYINAT